MVSKVSGTEIGAAVVASSSTCNVHTLASLATLASAVTAESSLELVAAPKNSLEAHWKLIGSSLELIEDHRDGVDAQKESCEESALEGERARLRASLWKRHEEEGVQQARYWEDDGDGFDHLRVCEIDVQVGIAISDGFDS
eukprot:CAMPEP_0181217342 /NCGR_PEP_ID=MMETSP1096-20121128/27098_1 /TAXON_ID=156174 ORGANISM="Chrysochromulina ericina, Strain CCMP281" /NCGR_SAMPLE_ID=MMETSP1096 /ASSEMBLY_ACC=CAM_ASM_000453 /LENGTH=140 /DNA_ID=CAMNT_0023309463 /DNA_START=584 /DNA_END=1003 /DNA_ORIENTATION=+